MFATIVILAFILLEFSNVLALYFAPGSKYANAVGVFSAWEKSKQDPEIHDFVRYLVNWVAGAKLIFLFPLGGDCPVWKFRYKTNEPDSLMHCHHFILLAFIPINQKIGSEGTN